MQTEKIEFLILEPIGSNMQQSNVDVKKCRKCSTELTFVEGDYLDKWQCQECGCHIEYVPVEGCCKNPDIHPVKIETKTGLIVKKQCLNCGDYASTAISRKRFDLSKLLDQVPKRKDAELSNDNKRITKTRRENKENGNQHFWKEYNDYLNSSEWRTKRQKVLERDGYKCQACLENNATEVHHLSYMMIYQEPLFDLISICNDCHDQITRVIRERREDNFFKGNLDYLVGRKNLPYL